MPKRLIAFSLLLAAFAGLTLLQASQAAENQTAPTSLTEEEQRLAEELLGLSLKLERTQSQIISLETSLIALDQELAQVTGGLEETLARLKTRRQELSRWLAFTYRNGRVNLISVLLKASSPTDFLTRQYLLQSILTHQAGLIDDVASLAQREETSRSTLLALKAEQEQQKNRLLASRNQLEELIAEREAAMEKVRREAQGLLALDALWNQVYPLLNTLLADFPNLPWLSLEPTEVKVSLFPPGASAVLTEAELNRTLLADPRYRELKLEVHPDALVLLKPGPDGFSLEGELVVTGPDQLAFTPIELNVGGIRLPSALLQELAAGLDLNFELPQVNSLVHLRALELKEDRLQLEYAR